MRELDRYSFSQQNENPSRLWKRHRRTSSDGGMRRAKHCCWVCYECRPGRGGRLVASGGMRGDPYDGTRKLRLEGCATTPPFSHLSQTESASHEDSREYWEDRVVHDFGSGLYLDLHAHGHEVARLELGYLLNASALNLSDAELDAGGYTDTSSIRALATMSPLPFSHVLRGDQSLGAFLGAQGIPSIPSPADPRPGADKYFSGGYNTNRHGSRHGGTVSGIQIELHYRGIRDTDDNRRAFGTGLAAAVEGYMVAHWGFFAVLPK